MNLLTKNTNPNYQNENEPPAKRYCLRSGAAPIAKEPNHPQSKSVVKKPYVPKKARPFIEYKGKVEYYTEFDDISMACEQLW